MTSFVTKQEDRMGLYFQSDDRCANQATSPLIKTQSRALLDLARLLIKPAIAGIGRSKLREHQEVNLLAAFHPQLTQNPLLDGRLIERVSITTSAQNLAHGLNRRWRGWIITRRNGTASVYLSATETARIQAAKAAQAIWLDLNEKVPWRLRDYAPAHLPGLFARTNLFNPQSSSVFYFLSVVDYSPTEAWQYARGHGLLRATVGETIHAVLDDLRSDFLHGSASLGDPGLPAPARVELLFTHALPARQNRTVRLSQFEPARPGSLQT